MFRTRLMRPIALAALMLLAVLTLAACSSDDDSSSSQATAVATDAVGGDASATAMPEGEQLIVGALHVGSVNDNGYNQAMHEGLLAMQEAIPGMKLIEAENVPESADAERVMENMIQQGAKVIFPQSFGYLDPALAVAERHPDVVFLHPAGFKQSENLGTFWSDTTSLSYLMGIVAASESETGKLGWVIGFPIPNILTSINAFTLGAQSVNPDVAVQVIVDNAWVDPAKEAESVNALADSGVDVVTMIVDSPATVVKTADARGIKSIGFHCLCVEAAAGDSWLTGIGFVWGPLFTRYGQEVMAGTWKSANDIGSLADGYAQIAEYGPSVKEETKQAVETAKAALLDGSLDIFAGPIVDNAGTVRIAEGETGDLGELLGSTDYLVQGASGKIN